MLKRPTRCVRCWGLLVEDQDIATIWRCVNCGCRGEGWHVWGTVIGSYTRAVHKLEKMGIPQQNKGKHYGTQEA